MRRFIHSARTVGGGADSHGTSALQRWPHMFPQRRIEPCTRYRSAWWSPVVMARRAISACNLARYSEE